MPTAPKIAYLSDALIRAILGMTDLHCYIPELRPYSEALLKEERTPRKGCASCQKKKATGDILVATRHLIIALPKDKLLRLKARIGVTGELRVSYQSEGTFKTLAI